MRKFCVKVVSSVGQVESGELVLEEHTLTLSILSLGVLVFADPFILGCVTKMRLRLERDGFMLLCNVARKDVCPVRMCWNGGNGRVYLLRYGVSATPECSVDIFGEASIDQVCTIEQQQNNYQSWLNSLSKK